MRRLLFSVLLIAFLPLSICAQISSSSAIPPASATHITIGQAVIALPGPWKFHIGDDPRWADPGFDDSRWESVDLTPRAGSFDPLTGLAGYVPGWTAKGHPGYWGYAWYRLRIHVHAAPGESLAIAGPANVDDVYQVFANGVLLGSFGKFPGNGQNPVTYYTQPMMFRLPQAHTEGQNEVILAFRVWTQPSTLQSQPDAGGFHSDPQMGQADAVEANYQLIRLREIRTYGYSAVEAALFLLLFVMACSMMFLDRSDPVYRWLAAVFLLTAINDIYTCLASWTQHVSILDSSLISNVLLDSLILSGWVMVWWAWFRLRRPVWMPKAIALVTALHLVSELIGQDLFFNAVPHSVTSAFYFLSIGIRLLLLLLLVLIVVWGVREQGRDGWLALPAVLLVAISQFQTELTVLHVRVFWFPLGVRFSLSQVADLTLLAVLFVLLIRRLLISLRLQRELALDVKQAQEVQQFLIPEHLPQVTGLAIESEYLPAREVGGDFFQILPHAIDGSVLIVAGDVTGHGLQAGMLVALIVGTIRTAIERSFDPLETLQALNRRLCGRGNAHATCLALRICADGAATLANAGHLPPYVNGKELPMEGALPLGMTLNAQFPMLRFRLQSGDRLMLLSDGVAEAQNDQGRLFGFDRIRAILQNPVSPAELAAAARTFGQHDDISVISITRTPVPEAAMA